MYMYVHVYTYTYIRKKYFAIFGFIKYNSLIIYARENKALRRKEKATQISI